MVTVFPIAVALANLHIKDVSLLANHCFYPRKFGCPKQYFPTGQGSLCVRLQWKTAGPPSAYKNCLQVCFSMGGLETWVRAALREEKTSDIFFPHISSDIHQCAQP